MLERIGPLRTADFDAFCWQITTEVALFARNNLDKAREVQHKEGYPSVPGSDLFTSLDTAAQAHFIQLVDAYMPAGIGLICEEGSLHRPSTLPGDVTLTCDPLDGTKVLIEALLAGREILPGQTSVMVGVVIEGVAEAGYICDIADMTMFARHLYGQDSWVQPDNERPQSMRHIRRLRGLSNNILLRHGEREPVNLLTRHLMASTFGQVAHSPSDSIGLCAARVFNGDFAAMLRCGGGTITPWDHTPTQAMLETGEVKLLVIGDDSFREVRPPLNQVLSFADDLLYIESGYLEELGQVARIELL